MEKEIKKFKDALAKAQILHLFSFEKDLCFSPPYHIIYRDVFFVQKVINNELKLQFVTSKPKDIIEYLKKDHPKFQ